MLYLAYGSNLYWQQMSRRCPSAQFVCTAKLKDHCLAFTRYSQNWKGGVADVVEEMGKDVWGVVYQIDEVDVGRLDANEGFRPGRAIEHNAYVRQERHVYRDGQMDWPILVSLYVATKQDRAPYLPHPNYLYLIIEGAKHWHLPEEYIAELKRIQASG